MLAQLLFVYIHVTVAAKCHFKVVAELNKYKIHLVAIKRGCWCDHDSCDVVANTTSEFTDDSILGL